MKKILICGFITIAIIACQSKSASWQDTAPTELDMGLLTRTGGWVVDTAATNAVNANFINEVAADIDVLKQKYLYNPYIISDCNLDYWETSYKVSLMNCSKIFESMQNHQNLFSERAKAEIAWTTSGGVTTSVFKKIPLDKYIVFEQQGEQNSIMDSRIPGIRMMLQSLESDKLQITFVQLLNAEDYSNSCSRILPQERIIRLITVILRPSN